MSELKAVHAFDVYEAYTKTGNDDAAQVYLKSEADKVIAELEKKLDIYKRGWMENDRVNANQYAEIRHHKYKRCLAIAKLCHWKMGVFIYKEEKSNFYHRWFKRWLKIADQLKGAK